MDAAYDKWNDAWSYERFLLEVTGHERQAVLVGNLNYQVQNGGIAQYVSNGYASSYSECVDVLRMINTDTTNEIATRLERFCDAYVETGTKNKGAFGDYWKEEAQYDDCDEEAIWEPDADKFDDFFYDDARHEQFSKDVEAYFASKS